MSSAQPTTDLEKAQAAEIVRLLTRLTGVESRLAQANVLIVEGNAQSAALIAELTAQIGKLADLVARSNERFAELAAAAARNGRKPKAATSPPSTVATPANLTPEQAAAFEQRPVAPVLPEMEKPTPKERKPKGRNALPDHLPPEKSESRPSGCGNCGGARLDVVAHFVEEKLTVVAEHQRRRITDRYTCRCRDCGVRTTGEAPPAPYARSKVTCEWLATPVPQVLATP